MKNPQTLNGEALILETKKLVAEERRIGVEILAYLREINRRRIFAKKGYSSLHEFCVKFLGYSEGAAYRRIASLKLTKEMPTVEKALKDGKVNFTTASQLHAFLRQEEKENNKEYSPNEKEDLLNSIKGKSRMECEQLFAHLSPKPAPPDKTRPLSEDMIELKFAITKGALKKVERVRSLHSNKLSDQDYAELMEFMAEFILEKTDPERKQESVSTSEQGASEQEHSDQTHPDEDTNDRSPESDQIPFPSLARPNSRYISARNRRELVRRSGLQCEHVDPESTRRCESRHKLQIDHIRPYALGGSNELDNLRLVCPAHNQLYALDAYGKKKMGAFVAGL